MSEQKKRPKVSVKTVTYNHENFIAQAIESVLMQKVDFDYEIVIGEDCSTDNTREIVLDYKKRFPDKIRLLLYDRNMGQRFNFLNTLKESRGEYVAWLDGDDYWTSKNKLMEQVKFLDSHPDFAMTFHNATKVYENGQQSSICIKKKLKPVLTLTDLLQGNFIPSCSVMFRNHLFKEFPQIFDPLPFGDWPLHVLNAQHGKIGFINEEWGAYRYHKGGIWTGGKDATQDQQIENEKKFLLFYKPFSQLLGPGFDDIIKDCVSTHLKKINELKRRKIKMFLMDSFPLAYKFYRTLKFRSK